VSEHPHLIESGESSSGATPPLANVRLPDIVRPLLAISRAEVLEYLAQQGLDWRTDETNVDARFLRNRVRHEVLPLLESLNPRVKEALVRCAESARQDLALVEEEAEEAWSRIAAPGSGAVELELEPWLALPPALQSRLLRRAYHELLPRGDLTWEHVEQVRHRVVSGSSGSILTLPGRVTVECRRGEGGLLLRAAREAIPPPSPAYGPVPLNVPGETSLPGGWSITAEALEADRQQVPGAATVWEAVLDADALPGALAVRGRRSGDRFVPLGMSGRHKSLQDLFVDCHVPRGQRRTWPVVVAGDAILWVPGLRRAEVARLVQRTRRVVRLRARPPARAAG
jgi:tRNA(Ile)-lysidine synthase